jgi:hypothetical protein
MWGPLTDNPVSRDLGNSEDRLMRSEQSLRNGYCGSVREASDCKASRQSTVISLGHSLVGIFIVSRPGTSYKNRSSKREISIYVQGFGIIIQLLSSMIFISIKLNMGLKMLV